MVDARPRARAREELYAVTGIQTMPINTVFQLLADEGSAALARRRADRARPRPVRPLADRRARQRGAPRPRPPACSTRARASWARELIERLGLPAAPFAGEPVEPGTTIGPVLDAPRGHRRRARARRRRPRHRVGLRRRAAAHGRTRRSCRRARGRSWASSSTGRCLDARARAATTSPTSAASTGTIRLLRNVMGLWLVQECRRAWAAPSYDELHRQRRGAPADVPLFDPDDDALPRPRRHARADRRGVPGRGPAPRPRPRARSSARSSRRSPASTALVLERLERVTGRDVDVVHVIGGGARNELLCRLTADVTRPPGAGRPGRGDRARQRARAGPRRRASSARSPRSARSAAASAGPTAYEPGGDRDAAEASTSASSP